MIVNMQYLKVPPLALGCALPRTVADPRPSTVLQLDLSSPVGRPPDCHNTICLSVPSDGDPKIVIGAHSMFDYIFQCNFGDARCSLGTVYQIEGTGVLLEVSLLFGPSSSTGSIAVFEGCLSGASATDGSDSTHNEGIFPDCVRDDSNQGTRWIAKKGHFYSIVVYARLGPSSKPFILRVNTAKSYPVCDTEEKKMIAPVDLGTVNATSVCEDSSAVDMVSGRFSATVNHHDAKLYRDLHACFAMYHGQQDRLQSSYVSIAEPINSPARVFKITGDGETYVAYATHSSAPDPYTILSDFVKMALFTVSECEATPQCVQGHEYRRTISFETTAGETYYLAVYNDDGDSLETLDLQLSFLSSKAPCEDATNLGIVGSSGRTISGTMDGANLYKGLEYGSFYEIIRARVFAFVAEKDGPFMVTVKGSVTTPYNCSKICWGLVRGECLHYTLLHVTAVPSCDVKAKLRNPGTPYFATSGVSYDVVVFSNHLFASEDFQLAIDFLETAEVCGSEHVVNMGSIPDEGTVFSGTTEFAPLFVLPQSCQVHNNYASPVTRAAKFSLTGDGNTYMLIMGAYSSHFQILVFQGSCEDLECMPQPEASRVLLDTKVGETYTVLVSDGTSNGEFILHVNKKAALVSVIADSMETVLQLLAFICLFASVFGGLARYRI